MNEQLEEPTAEESKENKTECTANMPLSIAKHIGLVVLILGFAVLAQVFTANFAKTNANDWFELVSIKDTPSAYKDLNPNVENDNKRAVSKRLQAQYNSIVDRANFHVEVLKVLTRNYYSSLNLVTIFSVILAALTLVIAPKGFIAASSYMKVAFLSVSAVVTFYGAFPGVFQQKENIEAHTQAFRDCQTLQNEILSYVATGKNAQKTVQNIDDFVLYMDERIAKLELISLQFSHEAAPSKLVGASE
ncbi:MAG: hypothetical protein PVG66_08035 [Chromatiales bacterium]|jgi:hypothetical protein